MLQKVFSVTDYQKFLNSRYFSEGIRMAIGVAIPLVVSYFTHNLSIGIMITMGSLSSALTDSPGPLTARLNGMLSATFICGVIAYLFNSFQHSTTFVAIELLIASFLFSMLNVYTARVLAVGSAALLLIVVDIDTVQQTVSAAQYALFIVIGGLFYTAYSALISFFTPYRIIKELTDEYINSIAAYLEQMSNLYGFTGDYQEATKTLLEKHSIVNECKDLVNEVLFKTRQITNNNSHQSRKLLRINLDAAEIFDSAMSTYQNFDKLNTLFASTTSLKLLQQITQLLANHLHNIGDALVNKEKVDGMKPINNLLKELKQSYIDLRDVEMTAENVDDFVMLNRSIDLVATLVRKVNTLDEHFKATNIDASKQDVLRNKSIYTNPTQLNITLFIGNISFQSKVFKHSLRVAIAMVVAYLLAVAVSFDRISWLLLTVGVILKPSYSLSKDRNTDRLFGTLIGVLIAAVLAYFISNKWVLLLLLILSLGYGFMYNRTKYMLSVIGFTIFFVLLIDFLATENMTEVALERFVATLIGSVIAFLATVLIFPTWERSSIYDEIEAIIQSNVTYIRNFAEIFRNADVTIWSHTNTKESHHVVVSLANVSNSLNRMLSEPKNVQVNGSALNRIIMLNHEVVTHLSVLNQIVKTNLRELYRDESVYRVLENTADQLNACGTAIQHKTKPVMVYSQPEREMLKEELEYYDNKRKEEIEKGDLDSDFRALFIHVRSVIDEVLRLQKISYNMAVELTDML